MKNTKQQQVSRKALPALSAEEELAELLADPTLQPSISFLGLRETSAPAPPDTDQVPDTESVPGTETTKKNPKGILFNSLPAPSAPSSIPPPVSVGGIELVSRSVSRAPAASVPPIVSGAGLLKSSTPRYQRPKAKRASTAEDGHSHIEHHVYETLWNAAEPQGPDTRILTIGFGTMSHLVRLSLNNCRLNVRSLIRKLAMEEHREELCPQGVGKTYLIYSPDHILRRRREAGLEWVIRTRGVVFVDPSTEQPLEKSL